ncbi:threonine-phosphate decarboxylase CobD [Shinella yambaruensis]|uniref:threonine-phosphate decarboxylase n=1 Tax=Shinella yambaruensis TaxID=415996 RepID=A0ABQ5ZEG9_9HYPH|nr:threonine-phosphate decarboxylase CobD [Shinella yambaruensis]MCJ8028202.1 threonine-phosphate decarboxylase CobD [Shinella yambaruensis]MCU7980316.1 threonine-phosphate decarboxylase CobD [Shinella yambaruensis]GLR49164.1 threonine-phosphate decarboxylase [Shinella yambaruensis]
MTAPRIVHGGGIAAASQRFGGRPEDWLDLSTGINPNPAALPEVDVAAWHRLPDRHRQDAARAAAAGYYGTSGALPLPVPGTQSVIQLLPRFVAAGRRAAVVSPTYGEYARVLENAGVAVDRIAGLNAVSDAHDLVVVVNPNNPDGRLFSREALLDLHRRVAGSGGLLVVDEAFGDMRPEATIAPLAGDNMPGLLVFRSFGKFFGLAGLRLGFVIGEAPVVDRVEDGLGPWAVSGPALTIATGLMTADTTAIRRSIDARKAALESVLAGAGLDIVGGAGLFALVDRADAPAIHEGLCRRHILVRPFDYNARWLRFGLAPDATSDARLAAALAEVTAGR